MRRQLFVQGLPDRQVVAAASPGGIGEEKDLAAAVLRQRVQVAGEVGQGEVGRLERGEARAAVGGGGAETGGASLGIDGERAPEQLGV